MTRGGKEISHPIPHSQDLPSRSHMLEFCKVKTPFLPPKTIGTKFTKCLIFLLPTTASMSRLCEGCAIVAVTLWRNKLLKLSHESMFFSMSVPSPAITFTLLFHPRQFHQAFWNTPCKTSQSLPPDQLP